jgi:hypothetical protein
MSAKFLYRAARIAPTTFIGFFFAGLPVSFSLAQCGIGIFYKNRLPNSDTWSF